MHLREQFSIELSAFWSLINLCAIIPLTCGFQGAEEID